MVFDFTYAGTSSFFLCYLAETIYNNWNKYIDKYIDCVKNLNKASGERLKAN